MFSYRCTEFYCPCRFPLPNFLSVFILVISGTFLAGHGEICPPPTWVIHMATRRPAHFPQNENRNEGTFAKTTLLRNRPFDSIFRNMDLGSKFLRRDSEMTLPTEGLSQICPSHRRSPGSWSVSGLRPLCYRPFQKAISELFIRQVPVWAASIRHLMSKTFCKFEPQIWLEIITSRDAKSACFKGSRTSCREIIFGIFWPEKITSRDGCFLPTVPILQSRPFVSQ